jgi:hypothetical protein
MHAGQIGRLRVKALPGERGSRPSPFSPFPPRLRFTPRKTSFPFGKNGPRRPPNGPRRSCPPCRPPCPCPGGAAIPTRKLGFDRPGLARSCEQSRHSAGLRQRSKPALLLRRPAKAARASTLTTSSKVGPNLDPGTVGVYVLNGLYMAYTSLIHFRFQVSDRPS